MTDERPITFDKGPRARTTLLEDLLETDLRLLSQVARRMRLVQRAAKGRQVLDRELEKQLWAGFDKTCRQQGLDPKLARQLFALLGSFGLEAPAKRRAADKPFTLVPRSEPLDVDITAPRSRSMTRQLAVLAAATAQPLRLGGVVLTDPLVELVKALNQAGAHLSWAEDSLEAAPAARADAEFPLRFEDVNDAGQVVGYRPVPGSPQHAFVYTPGSGMVDLGTLGGALSRAYHISNTGRIVGTAYDSEGNNHVVAWTPVPEPTSLAALSFALVTLGAAAKWRPRCP